MSEATPRPWTGNLILDLRKAALSVTYHPGVMLIDEVTKRAWMTIFPDSFGKYDHVETILHAVNNIDRLKERLGWIEAALKNAERAGDFEQVLGAYRAIRRAALATSSDTDADRGAV